MFTLIGLVVGLHFVQAIWREQYSQLLDDCSWVIDYDPTVLRTGGSSIAPLGFYLATPAAGSIACNGEYHYADTAPTGFSSWNYECSLDGSYAIKNFYESSNNCSETGGVVKTTVNITDSSMFNCGPTFDCFKIFVSWRQPTGSGCTGDKSIPQAVIFGVNGGCQDNDGQYELEICSDDIAITVGSIGYSTTLFNDSDSMCENDGDWISDNDGWVCHEDITRSADSYYMNEIVGCSGSIGNQPTPAPTFQPGIIDEFGDCDACCSEAIQCLNSTECESLADSFFSGDSWCYFTVDELYAWKDDYPWSWCNISAYGIDCDANGFNPLFVCALENECVTTMVDGPNGESPRDNASSVCFYDTCATQLDNCGNDSTCYMAIFNDSTSIFNDEDPLTSVYELCLIENCTVFSAALECIAGCPANQDYTCDDPDADDYDCWSCSMGGQFPIYACAMEEECFIPLNATLANLDDSGYDPDQLQANHDAWCALSGNAVYCANILYDSIWSALTNCSDCAWKHCGDEINACSANVTCSEELQFVTQIEQNYKADDDDMFTLVKEWYCANRTDGSCTDLLNTAYSCVETAGCLTYADDQCFEKQCTAEINACAGNTVCLDTLMSAINTDALCQQEIPTTYWWCPDNCDDLYKANYSNCGMEAWSEGTFDDYDMCRQACDGCGDFFNIGIDECSGEDCEGLFEELMVCIVGNCPDEDSDECWGTCSANYVTCMFDPECIDDFFYVSNNLSTIFNNESSSWSYSAAENDELCSIEYFTSFWNISYECEMDEIGFQDAYVRCVYLDVIGYCNDASMNSDGCNINFWNTYNCMGQCWGSGNLDTIYPSVSPTVEPTIEPSASPTKNPTAEPTTEPTTYSPTMTDNANTVYTLPVFIATGLWILCR